MATGCCWRCSGSGALPGALLAARQQPTGTQVRLLATLTGVFMVIVATAPDLPILFVGMIATGNRVDLDDRCRQHAGAAADRARSCAGA